MNKETIKKALEKGAVLQQIQEIVWIYHAENKLHRNSFDMANEIYNLVEKQVRAEFLNQPANEHDQEVRRQLISEIMNILPDTMSHEEYDDELYEKFANGYNDCREEIESKLKKIII